MTPFVQLTSHLVPIERENVDTDAILPKQYMAMITRQGYGAYLFDSWRYREAGAPGQDNSHRTPYPDFPLNMPVYEGAQILLGGRNFGCGSSREHAVWAIQQHGIRALIASSFADIFYGNCIRNGVLPISLPAETVAALFDLVRQHGRVETTIDLKAQQVRVANQHAEIACSFEIEARHKSSLLLGLDEIGRILAENRTALEKLEARRFVEESWLK
ncbi:3-isopropylmalate dehydratase small subunit [Herbaspirillum lusitanum]|uniref:3-isopropylmalate dehydratase small subunit n=1 Tax=Herbaspirillum lusitanum TaxID=213312 RepID=UPI002237AD2D|nr:3-isopropylmalate dehydratase small subunit [Herbaspirillum lusitanum]MCW5297727.1 3-isopropylmalate dehydratase small subunit [Herbaspirillum lusitanum]